MNILVIGKFYTEGFALHIAETLAVMGHAVRRFEPGFKSGRLSGRLSHRVDQFRGIIYSSSDGVPPIRARRMRDLWRIAENGPLDVVIVCHDLLWPMEVAELKHRTGATVAMWFPDALANFGKSFFMGANYDGLFFKDPYIVNVLSDVLSSPVYYLPECFNPDRHVLPSHDAPGLEYQCEVATAGNQHPWRVAFYQHLSDYHVMLWGQPAPLWLPTGAVKAMYRGRLVLNQDKAKAFLGAKIVVNNLHYGEIWGLNVRAFEAAGIGAFQLIDWRRGLSQLFKDGEELVCFRGIRDLKCKLNYWLPRDDERSLIAASGKRRAYAEHTYRHRLELMLSTLSGRESGFPMPGDCA